MHVGEVSPLPVLQVQLNEGEEVPVFSLRTHNRLDGSLDNFRNFWVWPKLVNVNGSFEHLVQVAIVEPQALKCSRFTACRSVKVIQPPSRDDLIPLAQNPFFRKVVDISTPKTRYGFDLGKGNRADHTIGKDTTRVPREREKSKKRKKRKKIGRGGILPLFILIRLAAQLA